MTLMGHPELSSFSPAYTVFAGMGAVIMGGGQAPPCTLFKNVVYGALRFWEEVSRFSTVLVERAILVSSTYLQDQLVL